LRYRKRVNAPEPGVSAIPPMFYLDDGTVTFAR